MQYIETGPSNGHAMGMIDWTDPVAGCNIDMQCPLKQLLKCSCMWH